MARRGLVGQHEYQWSNVKAMQLSIVTTMYRSAAFLPDFYRRATQEAKKFVNDSQLQEEQYEIIFVNDGSPDSSLDVALDLQQTDPHVIIIDLSRNFGHYKAMMTGLSYAEGDFVFCLIVTSKRIPNC